MLQQLQRSKTKIHFYSTAAVVTSATAIAWLLYTFISKF